MITFTALGKIVYAPGIYRQVRFLMLKKNAVKAPFSDGQRSAARINAERYDRPMQGREGEGE